MAFKEYSCVIRQVFLILLASSIGAVLAYGQSTAPQFQMSRSDMGYSSSSSTNLPDDPGDALALRSAIAQDNSGGGGGSRNRFYSPSHLALELGGGFNAPIGNDIPFVTWGGNFTVGAGLHFSRHISLLAEYQFIDDKLPGGFIAAVGNGATNGNLHIWSITLDPVIDFFPKKTNSMYITGGGGFYHATTSFNVAVCCDYYGYPVNLNTNGYSSRQGGVNFGFGYTHRLGGSYAPGNTKLFAEARYLYVDTPHYHTATGPTPIGTTELIPVTLGVRW